MSVSDAEAFDSEGVTSEMLLGLNVLSGGAVPAGRVCAWNSGALSASDARTPGLCYWGLVLHICKI